MATAITKYCFNVLVFLVTSSDTNCHLILQAVSVQLKQNKFRLWIEMKPSDKLQIVLNCFDAKILAG